MYGLAAQAEVICKPPGGDKPFSLSSLDFPWLTSLDIEVQMKTILSISIGVDIPYDQALEILSYRSKVFVAGTVVECRIGYPGLGQWTDWYIGVMNGADNSVAIGPAGVTGTLTANPYGMGYSDFLEKSLENISADRLLELIADKLGCKLYMWEEAREKLRTAIEPAVVLTARTPYQVLDEYATKHGCWYWNSSRRIDGKSVIEVATRSEIQSQPPSLHLMIRGGFGDGGGVPMAPLLSFDPEMSAAIWQYAQGDTDIGRGLTSYAVDLSTGNVITATVTASDLMEKTGNKDQAVSQPADHKVDNKQVNRQQNKRGAQKMVPVDPLRDPSIQLQNKISMVGNVGLSAVLEILGTPIDYTGSMVRVSGVGERFEGNYWIIKQQHNWSDGQWKTTLTGRNDGQYKSLVSDGSTRKGGANLAEPPPSNAFSGMIGGGWADLMSRTLPTRQR